MVISRQFYFVLLAALMAERAFELWLSTRNARRAFARGGIECGCGQYRIMVVFHTFFIIACGIESALRNPSSPAALSSLALPGEAAAQALRYWSIATLGERWNTRVIIIPNTTPITSGPYRYIRHPNYVAVALEMVCVPLIRGLVITAAVFSAANLLVLAGRIRLEEQALGDSYQYAFAQQPRFIPDLLR
jgi:methyltransferase